MNHASTEATPPLNPLHLTQRRYRASKTSQAQTQLATVLAAVTVRDELAGAQGAEKRMLQREYQKALGNVVQAFSRAAKKLVRSFQGSDYLGQSLPLEDLAQAVALGVAEAVARYRPERANGGCVRFVLTRVRFALQQLTGSQRKKYDIVGLEDVGEGRIS